MIQTLLSTPRRGGAPALLAILLSLAAAGAHAAGTAAGTSIDNKATLSYSVGNVSQASIGSSPTGNTSGTGANTSFVVDNKISHTVTTSDSSPITAVPGQTGVVTTFVVTNSGNNTQDYALSVGSVNTGQTVLSATTTFALTASSCSITVNGTAQSYLLNLLPDASATVKVACPMPAGQANNDVAAVYLLAEARQAGTNGATTLTAATTNSPSVVDIVFADAAGSDDLARDAKSSARSAYKISTATLTVQKTVATLCDPFNGNSTPMNIPGAFVTYTVTITNGASAGASATLGQISDILSTSVTFDSDLITGATAASCVSGTGSVPVSGTGKGFKVVNASRGAALGYPKYLTTTNADSDGASQVSGTIAVDFSRALPAEGAYAAGELKPGESVSVVYQVKLN